MIDELSAVDCGVHLLASSASSLDTLKGDSIMRVKKYIAALCIILTATTPTAAAIERQMVAPWHFKGRYYAQLCKVTRVVYNRLHGCDRVRLRNANGQIYVCWTDKGDYDRGDYVAVIMDTKWTPNVLDDAVVAIKYERPDLI